jgi:hypothetical protein
MSTEKLREKFRENSGKRHCPGLRFVVRSNPFPHVPFYYRPLLLKDRRKKAGKGGKLTWLPEEPGLMLNRTSGNFSPGASADVKKSHFHP